MKEKGENMAISKDKQRITVSMEGDTIKVLDSLSKMTGRSRSQIVEDGIIILSGVALGKAQIVTLEMEQEGGKKDEVN